MKAKITLTKEEQYEVEFQLPCFTKKYHVFYKIYGTGKYDAIKILLPNEYWGAEIVECSINHALIGNDTCTPEEFYQAYTKVIEHLRNKLEINPI